MRLRGLAEAAAAGLAALALACAMTYPLVFRFDRAARLDTTDGRFSVWNVAWVAHALTTDPRNVFQANIFYPHRNALAFSEANLVAGAIGAPVWWVTNNPYATHNTVFLLSFVLSAVGAYYLVRHLTGDRRAGAVAGVLYAYCPFIFARTAHIQLMLIGTLPFCMLAFHRVVDRPTAGRAAALGIALWLTGMSCAYYGLFAAGMISIGTVVLAATAGRWRQWRYWAAIALAAGVSIGLTVPFFVPYLEVQGLNGFARTLTEAYRYSANTGAWLASAAWAHRWWLAAIPGFSEVLFPGIVTTVLGVAGGWIGMRRRHATGGPDAQAIRPGRDVAFLYGLIAILAFWTALGPKAGLYTVLYDTLPVFSFLRAPARTGIVVTLCLVVLASIAVTRMLQGRRRPQLVAAGLFVVAIADLVRAPIRLQDAEPVSPAHTMLARLPKGAVIELPFWYERLDYHRHATYLLSSTVHWQPLINGYSDVIPQDFRDAARPLSSFPTDDTFAMLEKLSARYVVVHLDSYDARSKQKLLAQLDQYESYLRPLSQEGDVWLFEIVGWPH